MLCNLHFSFTQIKVLFCITVDCMAASPCQNDGVCYRPKTYGGYCACKSGYTGQTCGKCYAYSDEQFNFLPLSIFLALKLNSPLYILKLKKGNIKYNNSETTHETECKENFPRFSLNVGLPKNM